MMTAELETLRGRLAGELLLDPLARTIYSTDASEYQERPLAVALPKTDADVRELVRFAAATGTPLIPGYLSFGGMMIDPSPPHDLYFAHDLFSIVKYEIKTGNSYIFSL